MTILVTGGRGKIARAVATGLTAAGHDVRVASREPSTLGAAAVSYDPADPGPALHGISQVFLYSDPSSAPAFVLMQVVGGCVGLDMVTLLHPTRGVTS